MARVRVMVVDDSVVIRRLLTDAISADPDIEVALTAQNGRLALDKLAVSAIDLVVLDVEMPVLGGVETLKELRRAHRRLPVVMFSTLTARGAATTLDALAAGASDYVTKPANVGSVAEAMAAVREQLVPKIRALTGLPPITPPSVADPGAVVRPAPPARPVVRPVAPRGGTAPVDVVTIGCSTGGPEALGSVLAALPADLGVPIIATQHMPPVFTALFAERLDRNSAWHAVEATSGTVVRPGTLYLAPGDHHLEVRRPRPGGAPETALSDAPPEHFCRPAVDVMMRSVATVWGAGTLAVVLTGMGVDGCDGAAHVRAAGGRVLVQDRDTSVVWGMPGAVSAAGLADAELPIGQIADAITRAVRGRPRPSLSA